MEQQPVSKYLDYSGGKGYLWVVTIIIVAVIFLGLYYTKYHVSDYARWNVENPDADKIIWQTERELNPNMNQ